MKRALLIVLDSVGIGHAPDAEDFGDFGADTVGHIREAVPDFHIPTLDRSGLAAAQQLAAGKEVTETATLSFAALSEKSAGKDTTTGHWEIAGAPVLRAFTTFLRFPEPLLKEMEEVSGCQFLGNYAQSGTKILEELGREHLETGKPILYTSADSVIQIAAHEEVIPVSELYRICEACRVLADRERIGRVIARPFLGKPGAFERTSHRHDFSMDPPETALNRLEQSGIRTCGVGKISDIFASSGISESHPTRSNSEGCEKIDELLEKPRDSPQLIFANLVDFDMLYGHRRDPVGYANALMEFDHWLETLLPRLNKETLLLITADHGNDPTWTGTDHTRERVPLLLGHPGPSRNHGVRDSFADIAATLSHWFGVSHEGLAGIPFDLS
ncbi:MAG: phosphopentomutase [Verrucomicrobiales bacterium]|nr:phosphopentomutase [Verrucomicrobiales bacterium]